MKTQARRLALVEIIPTDRMRNRRIEYFPFIAGCLRARGHETLWLCLGVETIRASSGRNRYVYALPAEDRDLLCQALQRTAPSHVVINERLDEESWRAARQSAPEAAFFSMGHGGSVDAVALLTGGLGLLDGDLPPAPPLEEQFVPVYDKTALNERARTIRPFIPLLGGGAFCHYSRPLARNPHYQNVDLSSLDGADACSFCYSQPLIGVTHAMDAPTLAMRQIEAWEKSDACAINDREYLVIGARWWTRLEAFVERLIAARIPASTFRVSARMDELLRMEGAVSRVLSRFREHGHRLALANIGIENFSPEENERFNKGLSAEQIDRFFVLAREWRAQYPDTFLFNVDSGCSFILFTPWTSLEDLRLNLEGFRRHRLDVSSFYFGTSLQLLPGRPISALAQAHGLIVDEPDDCRVDSGCFTGHRDWEYAWRFLHPEVGTAYFVIRRFIRNAGDTIPADDRALRLIRAWQRRLGRWHEDGFDVFEALLDVIDHAGEVRALPLVLHGIEERLGLDTGLPLVRVVEDEADRFSGVDELLARLTPPTDEAPPAFGRKFADALVRNLAYRPELRAALHGAQVTGVVVGAPVPLVKVSVKVGAARVSAVIHERFAGTQALIEDGPLQLIVEQSVATLSPSALQAMRGLLRVARTLHASLRASMNRRPTPDPVPS